MAPFYKPVAGETSSRGDFKMQAQFRSFLTMPRKVTVSQNLIDKWQQMFSLSDGRGHAWGRGERTTHEIMQFVLMWKQKRIFFLMILPSPPFQQSPPFPTIPSHSLVFLLWVKNQSPNGHCITHIAKGCSSFCFSQSQVHAKLHQKKAKWGFLGHYTVSRLRNVSNIIMKYHTINLEDSLRPSFFKFLCKTYCISTKPN